MKAFVKAGLIAACLLLIFTGASLAAGPMENELVVYTTTGGGANWAEALIPKFQQYIREKYGVNIRVAVMPGDADVTFTKLQSEWPYPSGDVYYMNISNLHKGAEAGYFVRLVDHFTEEELQAFDPEWVEIAGGYMIPVDQNYAGLVVREDSPVEITSYQDLLDPRLRGRFTFSSPIGTSLGLFPLRAASMTLGYDWEEWKNEDGSLNEEKFIPVLRVIKEWADAALTLTTGSGSIRPFIQRGESYVAFWWWSHAITERDSGYPVRFVIPEEGAFLQGGSGYAVSSRAKNPNAALEWVKFMLTHEGFNTAFEVKHYSIIPRLDLELPEVFQANLPGADAKLHGGAVEFIVWAGLPEIQERMNDLFVQIVIEGR